jgi:hypothetical protein
VTGVNSKTKRTQLSEWVDCSFYVLALCLMANTWHFVPFSHSSTAYKHKYIWGVHSPSDSLQNAVVKPKNTAHNFIWDNMQRKLNSVFSSHLLTTKQAPFTSEKCVWSSHRTNDTYVKRVSQRSTENRVFSPGTLVSSHRECWQGRLGLPP